MEEITLKKDRVLKAAEACSTAKRTLEILCPEFFERKDGWYKDDTVPLWMFYFISGKRKFGFDNEGNWMANEAGFGFEKSDRPATPQEIEEALIKEAKKRGFKEGAKYLSPKDKIRNTCGHKFSYEPLGDKLSSGGIAVYNSGKWAEIIPSKKKMSISDIEKELGYEIEITNA